MFSRLFGSKKAEKFDNSPIPADWSFLKTDMHSHLLPGIDDGAAEIADSINMIKGLQEMGFSQIITTPHIKFDHYKNTPEIILGQLELVRAELKNQQIEISIYAAAEYYVDDIFMELLESSELLTLQKNELLIEFSFMFEPMNLLNTIFKIQTKGYRPVIAHPERYIYYHQKPEIFADLRDRGCYLQLNTLSALGYYGKREKEIAEMFLDRRMYDYCGTDMHHIRHTELIQNCGGQKGYQLLKEYPFRNAQIKRD